MRNGDISNETPPRLVVLIDVAVESEVLESRGLLRGTTLSRKVTGIKNMELSKLWMVGDKFGVSMELAALASENWTQEHLDKLMNRLDNRGGNPFNHSELYDDIEHIITELPYRANLKGVIDLPGRVARYGSWGIELQNL